MTLKWSVELEQEQAKAETRSTWHLQVGREEGGLKDRGWGWAWRQE
jgi:hypothetical protein